MLSCGIMQAMILKQSGLPLVLEEVPKPQIGPNEILIKVRVCALCRTDIHIIDGDLTPPFFPLILGHQIVGEVEEIGKEVARFQKKDRVGIPWLAKTCGQCEYCITGRENLCDKARFTGYHEPGGFAEYTTCLEDYAIPLPFSLSDEEIAPLLCAGLIGYRAYQKASPEKSLGLYGFGAAAHILTQIAIAEGKEVYAFTRDGDTKGQEFARDIGAVWAGNSSDSPPLLLDAAILFAPVGHLVPLSLKNLKKGGRCICGGIHMSEIPSFAYKDLWGEKSIASIANLTRQDSSAFFSLLSNISIHPQITVYPFKELNIAVQDLKKGKIKGSAVIRIA